MLVPNRNFSSPEYRYGFQGQEKDDEIKGSGNSINYKFRMHDPRVGRFFAVDPLTKEYPHYTPYQFSGNKVIHAVELEGLEEFEVNGGIINGPYANSDEAQAAVDSGTPLDTWDLGDLEEVTLTANIDSNNKTNTMDFVGLTLTGLENVNVGVLKDKEIRIYYNPPSGPKFNGNHYVDLYKVGKYAKMAGNTITYGQIGYDLIKVGTTEGQEKKKALNNLTKDGIYATIGYYYPTIGVGITAIEIMATTDEYKNAVLQAEKAQIQKKLDEGRWNVVDLPDKIYFNQYRGSRKCPTCPITYN